MKIPVFVSCPTSLSESQEESRDIVISELEAFRLEPRALGRSDYPTDLPLREILVLATHCSGGLILDFEQFHSENGVFKRGTEERSEAKDIKYATPWNHLESGILYSLGLPLLVFKEDAISGSVFDHGVSDVFIYRMPD